MTAKKQIKLTPKKVSSWIATAIFTITMVVLIFVSIFLYNNFYQAITETKEILVLKDKVALDSINMEKFNSIIDELTKKTTPKKLDNIASPFR
jgi:glycopeptide antibiotics resistance protein